MECSSEHLVGVLCKIYLLFINVFTNREKLQKTFVNSVKVKIISWYKRNRSVKTDVVFLKTSGKI